VDKLPFNIKVIAAMTWLSSGKFASLLLALSVPEASSVAKQQLPLVKLPYGTWQASEYKISADVSLAFSRVYLHTEKSRYMYLKTSDSRHLLLGIFAGSSHNRLFSKLESKMGQRAMFAFKRPLRLLILHLLRQELLSILSFMLLYLLGINLKVNILWRISPSLADSLKIAYFLMFMYLGRS
jgi:hypothetical protein